MPVTVLDVIVLVVVLISAILAMVRGFVREVLSVASWVAAAAAAYFFYKSLLPVIEPYFDNQTIAVIVSAAAIFFVALIVASYITMKISDFVIDSRIGAVDRAFGFIFGAVRGILLLVIALLFFNWLVPNPPGWVADARSKPFLDDLGERLLAALPEDAEASLLNRIRGVADPEVAPDGVAPPAEDDPAYDETERGGIDQLIENAQAIDVRVPITAATPPFEPTTQPFGIDDDKMHEECGVFGVFGHQDAAALTALGLHALQHRGQEAAGIVSFDGASFRHERHFGVVGDNFTDRAVIDRLPGDRAIGHVRYSTRGGPMESNIQPLFAGFSGGGFAVAHNGNITNALALQDRLQQRGSIFQSTCDTEVILHLIATSLGGRLVERMIDALSEVEGAWSLVCLTSKKMIGCRDPLGVRPLVLGELDGAYILASETCALDIIGARFVRDIEPGEMVVITTDGIESLHPFPPLKPRFCIFEYVYFSRPNSVIDRRGVYEVRKRIGAELAMEAGTAADLVVPVPDSGTPAAIGYAEAAGLPFDLGIIRNHYVGRTFIEPSDAIRHMGVKLKHNANRDILEGKRVILVDDSIVRGTTSSKIVQMVRDAGAAEVHMRIASPPTTNSCFYGVDTPEQSKLIASRLSVEEMEDFIKVDSLRFLSIDGLYRAVGEARRDAASPQFCDACFTGTYPTRLVDQAREGGRESGAGAGAVSPDLLSLLTETE